MQNWVKYDDEPKEGFNAMGDQSTIRTQYKSIHSITINALFNRYPAEMGSDRKSKDEEKKKTRKRSSPSSASEDEEKHRKRHRREAGERRSRKSDKKEKRRDKKSHKHRSDKDKKSKDKHSGKHHKGDHGKKFQELSSDDYFSKNNEFATWLKEEKDMFFSELSSESARHLFTDFVKDWNNKKLDTRYYEGISSGPRSAHNWTFKS
uniref:Style cell-cycle inhibitor 1-A n=1 Tax=Manihot esculenta TaxID=3983 RepID=A0A2C9UHR2_MANES